MSEAAMPDLRVRTPAFYACTVGTGGVNSGALEDHMVIATVSILNHHGDVLN
jgi:hypothetical protein